MTARALGPGALDVQAIRRHFSFPEAGRIVTNNAASTQPPRELVALYQSCLSGNPEAGWSGSASLAKN